MDFPAQLKYTENDEWVRELEDGSIEVGITDFAQSRLSDILSVTLPAEGDSVFTGEPYGDIESVRAVSDLVSPAIGRISAVNKALNNYPELLNSDPYTAWIVRISDITATDDLMDAAAYQARCEA